MPWSETLLRIRPVTKRGDFGVQVRKRPIRDGRDAILRGSLTHYFQTLKHVFKLAVQIGNSRMHW